jgi:hypothetical protein
MVEINRQILAVEYVSSLSFWIKSTMSVLENAGKSVSFDTRNARNFFRSRWYEATVFFDSPFSAVRYERKAGIMSMESIIKKIHNALCSIACCLNLSFPLVGNPSESKERFRPSQNDKLESVDVVRKIIFRYLSVPLTDDFKNIDIERALIDI